MFDIFVEEQSQIGTPLILVNAMNVTWTSENVSSSQLRSTEEQLVNLHDGSYLAIYDLRKNS